MTPTTPLWLVWCGPNECQGQFLGPYTTEEFARSVAAYDGCDHAHMVMVTNAAKIVAAYPVETSSYTVGMIYTTARRPEIIHTIARELSVYREAVTQYGSDMMKYLHRLALTAAHG